MVKATIKKHQLGALRKVVEAILKDDLDVAQSGDITLEAVANEINQTFILTLDRCYPPRQFSERFAKKELSPGGESMDHPDSINKSSL